MEPPMGIHVSLSAHWGPGTMVPLLMSCWCTRHWSDNPGDLVGGLTILNSINHIWDQPFFSFANFQIKHFFHSNYGRMMED